MPDKSAWDRIRAEFARQHTASPPLTYEALATKAKLPLMTVYSVLSKGKTPSIERAEAIANALGLTLQVRK
jgi:DNA-binding phage protein